jgi:hypothetical protein
MLQLDEDGSTPRPGTASSTESGRPEGWSPGHPSDFIPTEDEIVVNTAFVLLLNALTERKADMRLKGYRWLPNRDVFKIFKSLEDSGTKATIDSNKLLEARADDCFRHTESNLSAAIVEVKPSVRE